MTDLVAFITARLADTEAHARKDLHLIDQATPLEQWTARYGYNLPYSLLGEDGSIGRITSSYGRVLADGEPDQHQADVMLVARLVRRARREAERALREVEAKRRLLAGYAKARAAWEEAETAFYASRDEHNVPSSPATRAQSAAAGVLQAWDAVLRATALAWSDHPDYRAEWRP